MVRVPTVFLVHDVRRAPSLNIFKSMLDEVNLTTSVECDCNFCT